MLLTEEIKPKRKYQLIWESVIRKVEGGNSSPVVVKVDGLTDEMFKRIRKAYWKERDLDLINREKYRCHVERGKDNSNLIFFSVVPPVVPWKDRI